MKVQRIDHVGIIVQDLPAAKAFFLALGLEVVWEGEVGGELAERIIGLQAVKADVVMLRAPDGGANIELSQFQSPTDEKGPQPSLANTLGIRHVTFVVDDVDAMVANLQPHGAELVGEIQNYENIYKVCYLRGPEGILVELAEELAP